MPRCRAATAWARSTAASSWPAWTAAKDAAQVRLPEPLPKEVREHVARADREITDGYERQAVITFAGGVLGRAGLWADSDALLKANLAKSHSPYYLMSQLGGNARKQGRTDEALNWYAQAFDKSEGPATRLQWGAGYFSALVDLAPQDAARIEKTASQLLAEAARDSGAFEGRSVRSLQRVGTKLTSLECRRQARRRAAPPAGAARRPLPEGGRRRRPARRLRGAAQAGREEGGEGSVSETQTVDQARRRLAALLVGTPLAGALHAASNPNAVCPGRATDGGGDFTGRWVHAFAIYGAPKYGPDFTHFEYVDPRRAARRHAAPAQPRPPHQLRQVQPLHDARQCAGRRADLDVRGPGAPGGRRAVDDVRRCWPSRCSSPTTSRR